MVSPNAFTFRLRSCPAGLGEAVLREKLSAAFGDITPGDIRIHSLATAAWETPPTNEITVSDPPEHNQAASRRRPVLCPYRHIDTLCNMLNEGAKSAVTALVCYAVEEKRITCLDCEDGPFDSCVVHLHGGCSNCIITGREESCLWQRLDKRDSNSKRDHAPPPKTQGSDETRRPGPKQGAEAPADDSPCSNRPRRKQHAETPIQPSGLPLSHPRDVLCTQKHSSRYPFQILQMRTRSHRSPSPTVSTNVRFRARRGFARA